MGSLCIAMTCFSTPYEAHVHLLLYITLTVRGMLELKFVVSIAHMHAHPTCHTCTYTWTGHLKMHCGPVSNMCTHNTYLHYRRSFVISSSLTLLLLHGGVGVYIYIAMYFCTQSQFLSMFCLSVTPSIHPFFFFFYNIYCKLIK